MTPKETLINPNLRRSREGGNPVTFSQLVEMQRHWIPDIASRFRDDEQNQSFLSVVSRKYHQLIPASFVAILRCSLSP